MNKIKIDLQKYDKFNKYITMNVNLNILNNDLYH